MLLTIIGIIAGNHTPFVIPDTLLIPRLFHSFFYLGSVITFVELPINLLLKLLERQSMVGDILELENTRPFAFRGG